jgi:hypothetical protein
MIRRLGEDNNLESISVLHEKVLPESIFAVFGKEFLSKYFYKEVTKNEHLFCDIYEFDGRIIGFITYTDDSRRTFLRQLMSQPFLISFVLMKSIFKNFHKLKFLLFSIYFLFKQQKSMLPDVSAEILSFAVLPEYRVHTKDTTSGAIKETAFYREHGIRVGEELFNNMVMNLKRLNCKKFKIMTPANNAGSNSFYKKMGCELSGIKSKIFGLDVNLYLKNLD